MLSSRWHRTKKKNRPTKKNVTAYTVQFQKPQRNIKKIHPSILEKINMHAHTYTHNENNGPLSNDFCYLFFLYFRFHHSIIVLAFFSFRQNKALQLKVKTAKYVSR